MEKEFYFIRHGETLFNVQKKMQGWSDSPLTDLGIYQATRAKAYFERNKIIFDQCFCSTSERAVDTLELITNQKYTRLKGLKEWNFGKLEGENSIIAPPLPFKEFFVNYGGESEKDFQMRAVNTCNSLTKNEGKVLLIVSHGAFCGQFRRYWDKFSLPALSLENQKHHSGNCCIYKYAYYDNSFHLVGVIPHEEQS